MWVLKVLLFLVLLFVLVYFFIDNSGQSVDLRLFGREYLDIPLYWVLVLAYLTGFATYFVIAAVREIRFHGQLRRLRNDLRAKDREIADLRTLPLRDLAEPEEESDRE